MADHAILNHPRVVAAKGTSTSAWGGVFALTLCVSTLIASEFMPVSILTPIASDLHLTEGAAGQAIAISGLFAVLTSLSIATLTRGIDRRVLLLGLTLLMLVSGLIVAFAPNFLLLMVGRALLGIVIGGFWSMSAATVMRLVSEDQVPRALALLNGGNALATTIAAPLGSFLGQYIGWRGAFFMVVPLAAITFAWQWLTLPAMPSDRAVRNASAFGLLRRPNARIGMTAVALLFAGQFALFTYLRPFLEGVTQLSVSALSLVLLLMGAAGLLGTWLAGRMVARSLSTVLIAAPIALAMVAYGLVAFGTFTVPTALLLMVWGTIGTGAPVAWWTWVARRFPDDAEAGGGLMVAVVQLAITLGAAGGGLLFDAGGHRATFLASAALLGAGALAAAPRCLARRRSAHAPGRSEIQGDLMMKTHADPSGITRRNVLKSVAGSAATLSAMSVLPTQAHAQDMSNRADNFYNSDRVRSEKVSFQSQYAMQVGGRLFTPVARSTPRAPAIIVGHPMGAVKEQSANLYATKMAEQGFVAMSIDLPFWGESEGRPRNLVSPDVYAEAFSAAVDFLGTRAFVNRNRIGAIGICGSGSFVISAAKIDPRMKAIATVSMYDMGAANRYGLRHGQTLDQRKQAIAAAAAQRYLEFAGGETKYTSGSVHELSASSTAVEREFYDFYRTPRGEFTPPGSSPLLTTHPTLTSNVKFMNFYPFNDIETISPRPLLFITGDQAHSREFSEEAYRLAAEPKELLWVPGAGHVDLYDRVNLIPFAKLTSFFTASL